MVDVWAAALVSFGVVFVAELGDKSQLLALTFATRYKTWHVLAGISAAAAIIQACSVAVGAGIGAAVPTGWLSLLAAAAFAAFALWTLRGGDEESEEAPRPVAGRSAIPAVGGAFLAAELGDKTMFATVTLAAQYSWLGVWLGSTVAMVAVSVLAIIVGRMLGQHLPERIVRYGAAGLFALFGLVLLVDGVVTLTS